MLYTNVNIFKFFQFNIIIVAEGVTKDPIVQQNKNNLKYKQKKIKSNLFYISHSIQKYRLIYKNFKFKISFYEQLNRETEHNERFRRRW
jgi:hypothetical protein